MEQTKTALLVMDMQTSILSSLPDSSLLIANVQKAISAARRQRIPIIYVVVGFRPGMPEINTRNKGFSAAKERMASVNMQQWMTIHPELLPQEADIQVTKRRVSAFAGSDLEIVLRGQNIEQLILTGVATSGVVLSTLREAADKDYGITVLSDCCADGDEEIHRVLTTKIFPRQANVTDINTWVESWS